jgi:hypothetical protein
MITSPRPTFTYQVVGRAPGTGPVLAVLADGPTDLAVATRAADLAAGTRTLLVVAAAVPTGDAGVDPLRNRVRMRADTLAIAGRVAPVLHSAGVAYLRTALPMPAGADPTRALPVAAVLRLAERFAAVTVVAATVLHDPTGHLVRTSHPVRRVTTA